MAMVAVCGFVVDYLFHSRFCGEDCAYSVDNYCLCDSGQLWVSLSVNNTCGVQPRVRLTFRSSSAGILNCYLLILTGDVSLNAGPKYLCSVCGKCVQSNQKALECDGCQLWAHIRCVGVSNTIYNELDAKSRFSWHCPTCLFSELPSIDVIEPDTQSPRTPPSSSECIPLAVDTLKRPFSGVCIVHHNVQGIHSKMDDLTSWFNACSGKNVVLCFTEIWLTPTNPPLNVPGYQIFTSPLHRQPALRNGSARAFSNELSLNDCLEVSLNHIPKLFDILV